jgi:hypothetical protein
MRTFGSYDLIAPLAAGGMAQLWLARSPGADGIVVVKRLLRDHLGEPALVTMFDDEARLGEMLRHPNLVRQYEHGTAEGEPYLVLEYLQGEDLHAIRRYCRKAKKQLPLDVALEIILRICDGLHAAHELRGKDGHPLGVVHRDVSPQNTLVTFDGVVKIVDFGIAKRRDRQIETRDGMLKGKVPYMAPEQIQVDPIDRRTDLYAVGVMLYELSIGERPYSMPAPSEFSLMMAIVRGEIKPPRAVQPGYPPELEAIVLRALAMHPDRRPATGAELAADLQAFRRKAGLAEGQSLIADWMAAHFAERIAGIRKAQTEQELVARILDAEKRRGAQREADDEVVTAPHGAASLDRPLAGVAYALSRRPLGAVTLATLQGRINETFDGGAVGSLLAETPLVLLDLAGVERLTSYGVREWMVMLEACPQTELWLARCPEAVLTQLATIKSFAGHARVASMLLPFHCETCGGSAAKPFDIETDAGELLGGRVLPIPCKQCAGEATFDDDPSWLRFAKPWLGKPVPVAVRGALAVLARDSAHIPPALEKLVLGAETHVRIRNATEHRVRFRKLLDGVEGRLCVDVRERNALDERAAGELARALATLGPEVLAIEVRGAPPELVTALQGNPRVRVTSRYVTARCPGCDAPRPVVIQSRPTTADAPLCVHCNEPLVLPEDPPEPPPAEAPPPVLEAPDPPTGAEATPRPAAVLAEGPPAPEAPVLAALTAPPELAPPRTDTPPPRAPLWLLAGAAVALAGAAIWLSVGPAKPPVAAASAGHSASAPPAATPAPSAPPSEEVIRGPNTVEIVAYGRGATEDEAFAAARARAHVLLIEAIRKALATDVRTAVDRAARPTPAAELSHRVALHLGPSASLERVSVQSAPSDEGRVLTGRFRVTTIFFQKALSYWSGTESFRGLGVVPAFPTAGEAGWLVVAGAPDRTGVRPGDLIVAVGDRTLSPADRPSTLNSSAPELRLARDPAPEVIHWLP